MFPGTQALRVAGSVPPCSWKVGRESWNPQVSRIQGGPFPRESGQIPVTPRDPDRELISLPSLEDDIPQMLKTEVFATVQSQLSVQAVNKLGF